MISWYTVSSFIFDNILRLWNCWKSILSRPMTIINILSNGLWILKCTKICGLFYDSERSLKKQNCCKESIDHHSKLSSNLSKEILLYVGKCETPINPINISKFSEKCKRQISIKKNSWNLKNCFSSCTHVAPPQGIEIATVQYRATFMKT